MRARDFIILLVFVTLTGVSPGLAGEVQIPLTAGPRVLHDAVVQQVFTDPGARAIFWGQPGECSFFYLEDPNVETLEDAVRITAHGEARLGTEFLGGCLSPIVWSGKLEVLERPRLEGWMVRFDVVDSNVYDDRGRKTAITGALWDRIKESVHPRLGAVTVDLGGPFDELRALLPLVLPAAEGEAATRMLETLAPRSVAATRDGVTVVAALQIAEPPIPPPDEEAEPPLTDEEIEAFTRRMNEWDAFVTFCVRELGRFALEEPTREALLAVLLEARHEILGALQSPSRADIDPVRTLFVSIWTELRPVADELADRVPGAEALRLTTFVAAGDALVALDEVGPTFGLEVSSDGLRRMARMLDPALVEDPLEYVPWLDPKLRFLLGLGSPLEVPDERTGWSWPRRAWATTLDREALWREWVYAGREDVEEYLSRVGALLGETTEATIRARSLEGFEADLFRRMLPVSAWQESCWRQFDRRGNEVTYIASPQRSVGILQINERVWRGFYEPERLRWHIRYNARAGAEILHQYQEMVLRRDPKASEDRLAAVGRAVYAAYNGGPGQLRRYLSGKSGPKVSRVIDELFGRKLETAPKDIPREVARCLVGG